MKKGFQAIVFFLALILPHLSFAQWGPYDTIRVMTYNTLNYGFPSTSSCQALVTDSKTVWLQTIVQYADPDILGLVKMDANPSSFSTDTVVREVLDPICSGCYDHTPFTNNSGYDKENMLYYKTSKIGWISTTTIYSGDTNISDINLHHLFYRSPTLAQTHDTVFLNIILAHLASGSGSMSERGNEVAGAMSWLNAHITSPGNYIFMGDLNTQSSAESCFQQIVSSTDSNTLFYDPVDQLGDWSTDPTAFADYLTQSTRTADIGDCGSTDGMVNRFDHILCTRYLMDGVDSLQYLPRSFTVIGQDGQHTNNAINASPTNTSVPAPVLNALYYMSEHLPVKLDLAVGSKAPLAIAQTPTAISQWIYDRLVSTDLHISARGPETGTSYTATIFDTDGRKLSECPLNTDGTNTIPAAQLPDGVYMLRIATDGVPVLHGRFVKMGG